MSAPRFATIKKTITERFPELNMREAWSTAPYPRVLRLDTFHMRDASDWNTLKAQVENALSAFPSVKVGWLGAEIEVIIPRATRA